jgi:hypothetical protein
MAKFILTDGYVEINGVDLSTYGHTLDTPQEKERVDVSGFNSSGTKEYLPGSKEEACTIGFRQDFASSKVHQTCEPLFRNNSTFGFSVRATSGSVSATNPRFWGTASLFTYNGLSGEISSVSEVSIELLPATSTGFVWATS